MRLSLFLLACLSTFILHAQNTDPQEFGCHFIKQKMNAIPMSPEQQVRMQASLERSDTFDVLHYDISLDLTMFDQAYLGAETRIDFRARMDSLFYINLDLEGLNVNYIISAAGDTLFYQHKGSLLKVFLDTLLNIQDEYSVSVNYEGRPITCPSGFGGFYFEDGYAYNLGIGLQASPHNFGRAWFPCFDNFVERSTYTYNVISHNGRRAFAVGTFISEDSLGGDTIIRRYSMMQPIPTYLSHVAVAKYGEVRYMHQGKYGAIPVSLVAKWEDTSEVRQSFRPLGDALDCLEEWYGPYPFERVGYNMTSRGAMEHPTAVAYPDNSIQGGITNLGLITHELCHHWWGDITTLKTEHDMWLKEGPASYSEQQIIECREGADAFEAAVRTNNLAMINSAHLADEGYHPLSPMPDEWTYGRTTYDKGAAMIHNLRGYLGDSLFKVGMQSVLSDLAYQSINANEFKQQLEVSTGYDLSAYFDNWIFSPGWSDFYVDHFKYNSSSDSVTVTVRQGVYGTNDLHREVPLKIGFYHADEGVFTKTMICSGDVSTEKFAVPFQTSFVFANPNQHLNLASAGNMQRITANGGQDLSFTLWNLNVFELTDPYDLQITHHYIAPEDDLPDSIPFRLSSTHFWTLNIGEQSGILDARINYTGGNARELDYDLTQNTEDSIILVYRPNGNANWLEYPYYKKIKVLPTDGRGFIELEKVLSGQYAFANGPSGIFLKSDHQIVDMFQLYPNPATDEIRIEWNENGSGNAEYIEVVSMEGIVVRKLDFPQFSSRSNLNTIDVRELPDGTYFVKIHGKSGLISSRKFIKS